VSALRAVLLVGGRGVRLHPFTANFPKPLMPLDDTPILELLLRQLLHSGVRRVTLALGHHGELIRAYLARSELSALLEIDFVHEQEPLGTAGALSLVEGLDEPFLVMNGDVLTTLDFSALHASHVASGAALTIAAHEKTVQENLGVLVTDDSGVVTDYHEKPSTSYLVSMGVYAFQPSVLRLLEPGRHLDFPDLVLRLIAHGQVVRTERSDCLWLDIGRPDDYAQAQALVSAEPERFLRG
jgi:NDP-mannose synthase